MIRQIIARISPPLIAAFLFAAAAQAQWTPPNPVTGFEKQPDGIVLHMKSGTMRLQVCAPSIIHLLYSPTLTFPPNPNPAVIKTTWPESVWTLQNGDSVIALQTTALKVAVDRTTGAITY